VRGYVRFWPFHAKRLSRLRMPPALDAFPTSTPVILYGNNSQDRMAALARTPEEVAAAVNARGKWRGATTTGSYGFH